MKVCCLIDSLNSGGAQRQMTWLIRALASNGHQVRLLTYHKFDHYLEIVRSAGVEPECFDSYSKVGRFSAIRSAVRKDKPDVIVSFLDTPNFLGLFAGMSPNRIPVIVSERNQDMGGKTRATSIRFNSFRLAAKVVTNCHSQNEFISENYPFLKQRLATVVNCVDLGEFSATHNSSPTSKRKLIVAASVIARKNAQNLIRAVKIAADDGIHVEVDWFGNNLFENGKPTSASYYFLECEALVKDLGVENQFRFLGEVSNIHRIYGDYDGCCLPSVREGCPNVICEAMASGLPVLVSDHGDMKRMAGSAGGFCFQPDSPRSIADALIQFADLSQEEFKAMGVRNRKWAEEHLSPERFAAEYESIIKEVLV